MKYHLNIELTEAEAITLTSAMFAAEINNGKLAVGGSTSGFRKVYNALYSQLPTDTQGRIDEVMSAFKDIMGKPSFTRAAFQGATDSLKEDLKEAGVAGKRKKKGGGDGQ